MLEIFYDIEQGTDEWRQVRCGLPTASMFKVILAEGRDYGESLTRKKYLRQLAGEIITGKPMETYENYHMRRGKALEAEARRAYAFLTDTEPKQIGFARNDGRGCSPDALIGNDGAVEIKTCLPDLIIEMLERDEFVYMVEGGHFPPMFKAQTQGQIWTLEREWVDLFVFWPGVPAFMKRAYRDSFYIRRLSIEVDRFNSELSDVVERVRAYGMA